MATHKERLKPQRRGLADPGPLRDCLEAVDTAIIELGAVRQQYLESTQDAFTPLRSSAQLFREIFFGIELPVKNFDDLLEKAGGPFRLLPVTYKESGPMVVALGDVLNGLPEMEKLFPVTNFETFAERLESLRENMDDSGTSWFVSTMKQTYLKRLLKMSVGTKDKKTLAHLATLSRPRRNFVCCTHCGVSHSPAAAVTKAFDGVSVLPSAHRWTGKRERS